MSTTSPTILNARFRDALHRMEHGERSLFITGKAGTGKSTLLSHFCERTGKKPVVLAPTGVAALNVRGQTIHKFFNFYVDVTPDKIRRRQIKPRNPRLYAKLKTIIIDEVSMVRADLLDCIDEFLRLYGPDAEQAFGGVQMIFVGDLYQLPPVIQHDSEAFFDEIYETPYFFSARALRDTAFDIVELDTIYRQKEQPFVEMLNRIRTNHVTEADIDALNARVGAKETQSSDGFRIHLTTTNSKADEINALELAALPGKQSKATAIITGEFGQEYYPTVTELTFKIGAQIMLLNNDTNGRWVNGSIGVIAAIKRDEDNKAYAEVRLRDEIGTVAVYPHTWEVFRYVAEGMDLVAEAVGTFTQFPFRLAWAVTIHKSQGKTFEQVTIDIDRGTFASGQVYVALSRCTTLEGISLKRRIDRHHIRADARILDFLERHPYTPPAKEPELDERMLSNVAPEPTLRASQQAAQIITQLIQGLDPVSGAQLPDVSPYRDKDVQAALQWALDRAQQLPEKKQRVTRDGKPGPAKHGKSWTDEERAALAHAFTAGEKNQGTCSQP